MKKEEVKKRFKELLLQNPPLHEIENLFTKALESGALDYENENERNYRIAKTIYHAILCTMADQWTPHAKENKEESANLQKFL